MTAQTPDISALVGSRICHDLISPLGAIGNGLELLSLTGEATPQGPEMALIAESVDNASARVRFFRVAFGAAAPGQSLGRADLLSILSDSFRAGRIAIDPALEGAVPRAEAKLALLLVLCLETTLPRGGTIRVEGGAQGWRLRAEGPDLRIEARLWQGLAEGRAPDGLSAAEVQFALLPEAVTATGRALAITRDGSGMDIRF